MSRFNKSSTRMVGTQSAVRSTGARITTHEGGSGYARDAKSELFLLTASFMGGDDNFYEKSRDRYARLIQLVTAVVEEDGDTDAGVSAWMGPFVRWLRRDVGLRTVAMVVAVEAVAARLARGWHGGNRELIAAACDRADEPGEVLAYWLSRYGKMIPKPIKNGVADAARRLYDEFSFLKYGKQVGQAVKAADVIRLTHPIPKDPQQSILFSYIAELEHRGPESPTVVELYNDLPNIYARKLFMDTPREERIDKFLRMTSVGLRQAVVTWEVLSEWYPRGLDKDAWEAIIPNMGLMALVRNLRNFDEAGISREAVMYVQSRIEDADEIRRSRIFPYRFYHAYKSVESVRWSGSLDHALTVSVGNIPTLSGRTLILVDRSASMFHSRVSERSDMTYADIAALFGTCWMMRNPNTTDLYQYGSNFRKLSPFRNHSNTRYSDYEEADQWHGVTKRVAMSAGASVLRVMSRYGDMGGTETHEAVRETYDNHDRVVLITDEQSSQSGYSDLPTRNVPVYIWNLAGYRAGTSHSGKYQRHTFGGLTDSSFKLIPVLEAGHNASWPWEETK
jgi:hypothetical protein